MKKCFEFVVAIMVVLLLNVTADAEDGFNFVAATVDPTTAPAGSSFLLTCQIQHDGGAEAIRQVGATITIGDMSITIPKLTDDGLNGDELADDGIYSGTIATTETVSGEGQIIFSASDVGNQEVLSDAITIVVQ